MPHCPVRPACLPKHQLRALARMPQGASLPPDAGLSRCGRFCSLERMARLILYRGDMAADPLFERRVRANCRPCHGAPTKAAIRRCYIDAIDRFTA